MPTRRDRPSPVEREKEKNAGAAGQSPAPSEPRDATSTASKPQGTLEDQVHTMESEGQAQPQEGDLAPEQLEQGDESGAAGAGSGAMSVESVFAQVICSALETRLPWFEALFGTAPTRCPMQGLAEWRVSESAEVQLFEDPTRAGKSTLTLRVADLEVERQRLRGRGVETGDVEHTKDFTLTRLHDPDGNLVVLVEARS